MFKKQKQKQKQKNVLSCGYFEVGLSPSYYCVKYLNLIMPYFGHLLISLQIAFSSAYYHVIRSSNIEMQCLRHLRIAHNKLTCPIKLLNFVVFH